MQNIDSRTCRLHCGLPFPALPFDLALKWLLGLFSLSSSCFSCLEALGWPPQPSLPASQFNVCLLDFVVGVECVGVPPFGFARFRSVGTSLNPFLS